VLETVARGNECPFDALQFLVGGGARCVEWAALGTGQFAAHLAEGQSRLGNGLLPSLIGANKAFDIWHTWRLSEERKAAVATDAIGELRSAGETMRESLCSCHDMLQESRHDFQEQNTALVALQGHVCELQDTQVRSCDVDERVEVSNQQVREMFKEMEAVVDGIVERLEAYVCELNKQMKDISQEGDDRTNEQMQKVQQLLETHLNPVSAFLNNMHVKSDVVRVELDKLLEQVSQLERSVENVMSILGESHERHQSLVAEFTDRFEHIRREASCDRAAVEGKSAGLSAKIEEVADALSSRLEKVMTFAGNTSEGLESVKKGEISTVTRDLLNLEQKVAKWVHAHPLPAKISEARLYALEARLNEQVDAHIKLESSVKERAQRSFSDHTRLGNEHAVVLPSLPLQPFVEGLSPGRRPAGAPAQAGYVLHRK